MSTTPIQQTLFPGVEVEGEGSKYTGTVKAPVYTPRGQPPPIALLYDTTKAKRLIAEVNAADIPEEVRQFLRAAAWRHAVFQYEPIADFYASATPEVQRLMERSGLVIIDFNQAIELGYVQLCKAIREKYLEGYVDDDDNADPA